MDPHMLKTRAGLYSILRALYTYPLEQAKLDALANLPEAPTLPGARWLKKMQGRLRENRDLPAIVEALNIEMTRLLEGPGQTPSPPYASYYLYGGQLMGPSAVDARRAYLEWRVLPDEGMRRPDDHVALELGFMSHLAGMAAEETDAAESVPYLQASLSFLRQHLLPWLPAFCQALAAASKDPFFIGLAHFTKVVVEADCDWLETIVIDNNSAEPPIGLMRKNKESST